jgi:FAD:protein FMN transferase
MACDITLRVVGSSSGAGSAMSEAQAVFHAVERACTRFNPASPLMLMNADPDAWHQVPTELYDALVEAFAAYRVTEGRFDPRVLRTLENLGYDRSLPFAAGDVVVDGHGPEAEPHGQRAPWVPGFDDARQAIHLGPEPVDLGGIGKGLAVRWAAERLTGRVGAFLVEAGGDCYLGGSGPAGTGWRIGVEDPVDGIETLAVLQLSDLACATSSIRLRRWRAGERRVHHLIDPRTGQPGGAGLLAVTVVGPDPAVSEIWSKALFLCGADGVAEQADERGLAALWVDDDGRIDASSAMDEHVIWRVDRVQ